MRLNRMLIKHCPEVAELYITPCNLWFYECNGVEAFALGARVVQDTGQAGALIVSGATVGITPQGLYSMEGHALPQSYITKTLAGRRLAFCRMDRKLLSSSKRRGTGVPVIISLCTTTVQESLRR